MNKQEEVYVRAALSNLTRLWDTLNNISCSGDEPTEDESHEWFQEMRRLVVHTWWDLGADYYVGESPCDCGHTRVQYRQWLAEEHGKRLRAVEQRENDKKAREKTTLTTLQKQ